MSTKGIHVCPYPVRNVAASCLPEFMGDVVKSFMNDHTDRLRVTGQEAMFRTEKREKKHLFRFYLRNVSHYVLRDCPTLLMVAQPSIYLFF